MRVVDVQLGSLWVAIFCSCLSCMLVEAMVHKHSPDELVARCAAAAEHGFLQPTSCGKTHMLVNADSKPKLQVTERGRVVTNGLEPSLEVHRRSPMASVRLAEEQKQPS